MLYSKLSDHEKRMIGKYIDEYANCPIDSPAIERLENLLRFWNNDKMALYRLLGSNFIISKKVRIEKHIEEMTSNIRSAIFSPTMDFIFNYRAKIVDPAYQQRLRVDYSSNFDQDHYAKTYNYYYNVLELIDVDTLANNIYKGDSFEVPNPKNGRNIAVNTGCKVSRILGKIADAYDIDGYEEFRIAHSQVLNNKMVSGELCLSIHPLDFMTASDNNCDWDSCMSWMSPGSYRAGTVEMMNSPMVVIAYLRSKDDFELFYWKGEDSKWNNKKWREFFIVSPDLITNVMDYPYHHETLETMCLEWLRELAIQNCGWEYCEEKEHGHGAVYLKEKNPIRFATGVMYNDMNREDHQYYIGKNVNRDLFMEIYYSGATVCLNCGRTPQEMGYDYFAPMADGNESFCCTECRPYYYCEDCGECFDSLDEMVEYEGKYYCQDCWDNNFMTCDYCDSDFFAQGNEFQVKIVTKEYFDNCTTRRVWDWDFERDQALLYYCCPDCYAKFLSAIETYNIPNRRYYDALLINPQYLEQAQKLCESTDNRNYVLDDWIELLGFEVEEDTK